MSQPLLALSGVGKTYRRGALVVEALKDITLTLAPGSVTALTGPSGSGKTTLLNILGTLDRPDAGTITLNGTALPYDHPGRTEQIRRRSFGFIFQTFNLVPVLTAVENVELPLFPTPLSARARRDRARALLESVGLGDRLHHRPAELSGGQQQRVAVARALVHGPALVLADEPTASLDSASAFALIDLLTRLNAEEGVSFLFSTHDSRLLDHVPTRFTLKDGRLSP